MQKFRVRFKFDNENSTSFIIDAESKEMLYSFIVSNKDWYEHEDNKGVLNVINMNLVTSFSIVEYKQSSISSTNGWR
ncbi:hypothetical protein Q8G35_12575 [Peribacillus simplex]|uniref:Uncharacterized protein n=2 Tax=Peribacillus TaxID=2675229 RepID=A0AA90P4J0_9BACI|nr:MULTISPECIES: hypothetical protein [Peribacillus]MDP1419246.1 hypothetical protein [Peribacillus simplex]MDP1452116.1 hypothetical protein [Peribacillus frigoritolerans]